MSSVEIDGFIRCANKDDMTLIHNWLREQHRSGVEESFLCNWEVINRIFASEKIFVYVESDTSCPIAYLTKGFDILEVKYNFRGKGIGRALVNYGLIQAKESNETIIDIECMPESSIPFWEHMGFKLYDETHAYIKIEKINLFGDEAVPADVKISFYPERRKWNKETMAIEVFRPDAAKDQEGIIDLQRRVSIFTGLEIWDRDPVVNISINGNVVYEDKAKYDEALWLGVRRTLNSFYIDSIHAE